jgi:anti-sigma factor RsiW
VTCREFADFMSEYLGGELAADARARFERHLSRCPSCVAYLAHYRATVATGKKAFAEADAPAPADIPEELIQAILASRPR